MELWFADIRDIKAPIAPVESLAWWWAPALLAAAALAGWLLWRYRRQRTEGGALTASVPPHLRALERLERARELMDQPRAFGIAVSDALRVYLEERFQFHAPERTTEEFIEELRGNMLLHAAHKQLLGDFLSQCDLVKFARYQAGPDELERVLEAGVRLVRETEPAPLRPEPRPSELEGHEIR